MEGRPGASRARGAYGLRLVGLDHPLLVDVDSDWPQLELLMRPGSGTHVADSVDANRAAVALASGGDIVVDRLAARAVFTVPPEVTQDAVVHPYLAPVAALFGHWLGRESLHAGAVLVEGAAWAILGDRGAGKSSLLAVLAAGGHAVLADDLLVLDSAGTAFAAPRAVDLRADAAEHLGVGELVGRLGTRERWRLELDSTPPAAPLSGWIALAWGAELATTAIPVAERLRILAAHRAVRLPPEDPGTLLRLAALPAWSLTLPQDWSSLEQAAERLRAIAARTDPSSRGQPGAA